MTDLKESSSETIPIKLKTDKIPIKSKTTSIEVDILPIPKVIVSPWVTKSQEPVPPPLPEGLYYIPNFLTPEESKTFLENLAINEKWVGVSGYKNSRRVIHYGYIYSYAPGGKPLQPTDPIPDFYQEIWARIPQNPQFAGLPFFEKGMPSFDQLIINEYHPGQGIAAHTDHTTKFGPVIACVTLGSGVEIEFTRPGHESFKIYTEPNSLYIMSGDSRYLWKHEIIKRKNDLVGGKTHPRGTRVSLTFRKAI
jgi:alkylated DNA repair dioxygenase AlkB